MHAPDPCRGKNIHIFVLTVLTRFRFSFVCLFCVCTFHVSVTERAFQLFSVAVDDLPSFLSLLSLLAGLMPRNLEHVMLLHYWPARTLARCNCIPFDTPTLCIRTKSGILSTVFLSFYYLVTWYTNTTAVSHASRCLDYFGRLGTVSKFTPRLLVSRDVVFSALCFWFCILFFFFYI